MVLLSIFQQVYYVRPRLSPLPAMSLKDVPLSIMTVTVALHCHNLEFNDLFIEVGDGLQVTIAS